MMIFCEKNKKIPKENPIFSIKNLPQELLFKEIPVPPLSFFGFFSKKN